ncbi:MAG: ABC transporter permease subunit [Gemmatimonadota bacterium]
MTTMRLIAMRQASDIIRSRWVMAYALFFAAATEGLLRFAGGDVRALLSLANAMLFVTPLVTIVFGTVYLYNAREFIELLLAQPVRRRDLFGGLYLGLTATLVAAWLVGVGVPFLLHGSFLTAGASRTLLVLLATGAALTASFTALATLVVVRVDDRLKGLGVAIATWFVLALLYDGVVLLVVSLSGDRNIEPMMLVLMALNPVDLARVLVLLQLDVAALLGYTGAVFTRIFAGPAGAALGALVLSLWIAAPLALAARLFRQKDF